MAEKGAHLTGTTFKQPSIFEIIAQQSLSSTLEPAFKKILSFLVSFNFERYGHLLTWSDEGYAIFNTVLQQYYLKKYSASFSETFYGLQRISALGIDKTLSKKQKRLSLMLLVLFPYIKAKLIKLNDKYKSMGTYNRTPQTQWQKFFTSYFTNGYTIGFVILEFIVLYYYIRYISGRSIYPTPELKLLSITLTYSAMQPLTELLENTKNGLFNSNYGLLIFERSITRFIELGAFVLQFLSWQGQENYYTNIMSLPVPPPPKIPTTAQKYKGLCPICGKVQHIHTALMVSGYVFCYQCILPVIRKSRRCPITHLPASEDDLIRLYIE